MLTKEGVLILECRLYLRWVEGHRVHLRYFVICDISSPVVVFPFELIRVRNVLEFSEDSAIRLQHQTVEHLLVL